MSLGFRPVLRHATAIAIAVIGAVATLSVSWVLYTDARMAWELEGDATAEELSREMLSWLEESYAPISGLGALVEASPDLSRERFLSAYEGLEARASAIFLDAVALVEHDPALVSPGNPGGWRVRHSTDDRGALAPGAVLASHPGILGAIDAATARLGEIILARPQADLNDALPPLPAPAERPMVSHDAFETAANGSEGPAATVSPVVLVVQTADRLQGVVGLVDFNDLVAGLRELRLPKGVSLRLSGQFAEPGGPGPTRPILSTTLETPAFSVPIRTISAGADLLVTWDFDHTFSGGPSLALAGLTLTAGLVGTGILTLLVAILLRQNALVIRRVDEATFELEEKQHRMLMILDNMPGAMWLVDQDLKLVFANRQYTDFYGDTHGLVAPGADMRAIVRQEAEAGLLGGDGDIDTVVGERLRSFRITQPTTFEDRTVDGGHIQVLRRPTGDGNVISVATDITDRKRATQAMEHQRARMDVILQSIRQGIVLFDHDRHLAAWNDRFPQTLNLDPGILHRGLTLGDITLMMAHRGTYGDGDPDDLARQRAETLWTGTHRSDLSFGGDGIFDTQSTRTPDGGLVVAYTDVTERHRAERLVAQAMVLVNESIHYASRIQRAVLPRKPEMSAAFADHLVIWEPKDVVGGDVYLLRRRRSDCLLFVADCTGHGIPGAFMTMIATGAVDQAIIEIPDGDPARLLGRINRLVKITLGQTSLGTAESVKADADEGFDCALCRVPYDGGPVTFAGAGLDLWSLDDGTATQLKGGRMGIGYRRTPMDQAFTSHDLPAVPGTAIYLVTDGLTDQVGGPSGRAFGRQRLRQVLQEGPGMGMVAHKDRILRALSEWQGEQARRDDVTVVGFIPR